MAYDLCNRRYIGNKYSLLGFIDSTLANIKFNSFADLFAGTGVVAEHFMNNGKKVIVNDNLFANYIFYIAWLSQSKYNANKIQKYINYYNESDEFIIDNYFSDTFSDTYFHYENAKKIGSIREHLESNKSKFTKREFAILLSSLAYTTDRIANTVGHFEAFLGTKPIKKKVILQELNIKSYKISPDIYQKDANEIIKNIQTDILYIDPPYNARQYINFYHVLENLIEWKKPNVFGKTLKMARNEKKSKYSQSSALSCLKELISNAKTKYILISYNNTYEAKSMASINKISAQDIRDILSKIGKLKEFELDYRFFNTGKTDLKNHKEILYLCELK